MRFHLFRRTASFLLEHAEMTSLNPIYTGPMSTERAVPSNRRAVHSHRKSFEVPRQMAQAIKQSIGHLARSAFNHTPRRPGVHPSNDNTPVATNVIQVEPSPIPPPRQHVRTQDGSGRGPRSMGDLRALSAAVPPSPPPASGGPPGTEVSSDGFPGPSTGSEPEMEPAVSVIKIPKSASAFVSPLSAQPNPNRTRTARKSFKLGSQAHLSSIDPEVGRPT